MSAFGFTSRQFLISWPLLYCWLVRGLHCYARGTGTVPMWCLCRVWTCRHRSSWYCCHWLPRVCISGFPASRKMWPKRVHLMHLFAATNSTASTINSGTKYYIYRYFVSASSLSNINPLHFLSKMKFRILFLCLWCRLINLGLMRSGSVLT